MREGLAPKGLDLFHAWNFAALARLCRRHSGFWPIVVYYVAMNDGSNECKLLQPGEMFGDYTVEKLLGKGGMGAVYLVRAPGGERYAVKVMDANIARDMPDTLKRFLREAEFAITIRHPNLIPVHRVGQDTKTRLCYLVMDYMPGGSLADRLGKRKRLSVEEALSIVVQIAGALEVAHRHGVIHRDIKPDNILFDLDGTPKLADMGVAKFTDGTHKTTVTTTGMIIGTPAYMAPEQMIDSRHIDARADIYALGVVLYEMLTGCRPHEESTAVELLAKAIKGEPLPDVRTLRPEVSAALAYVLSLMCAPKPEERPSTPHVVVEMVQQAENGTLEVPQEILTPPVAKREWRKKFRVAVPVAAALFFAGAVGWGASKWLGASKERQGLVQFTNAVNQVTVVTNQVIQAAGVKEDDAADPAWDGEHASSGDDENVQRDISEAKTAEPPKPLDFSSLDPIRYAEMDDRTMVKELLSIDADGTIRKDVARHGGIDGFCRRKGPLSVSRRKALVNTFIIRDALVLIGLPRELMLEAVTKARNAPKVVNMSIGKLLQMFPALQLFLADPVVRRQASSDISQKVVDFLLAEQEKPKREKKTSPVPGNAKPANGQSGSPRLGPSSGGGFKIGIAEPSVGTSVSQDDALVIWDDLEVSFKSKEYTLISRAALQQLMTEIGLTTSSDLLNMNATQKAKLGQIEGIKYLIVPSLRKLGTRITLSLKTVESSTGEVDQERTATLKATSLDDIADKLESALEDMLKDKGGTTVAKSSMACALLTPVIKMAAPPTYLRDDFNTWVQSALLANGIRSANCAWLRPEMLVGSFNVTNITDESRFQATGQTEMKDQDYIVLGQKLRVRYLIQTEITNFEITATPWSSLKTGAQGYFYHGMISARMKVVDANDGSLKDSVPIEWSKDLGRSTGPQPAMFGDTYGKQMIAEIVTQVVEPRLAVILGLK